MFNEKVMAGLGRGLGEGGAIDAEALDRAVNALARFAALAREMEVDHLRTVATAAVRDASNGGELIDAARAIWACPSNCCRASRKRWRRGWACCRPFPTRTASSAIWAAAAWNWCGSSAARCTDRVSFPLGVLRIAAIRAKGKGSLDRFVARALASAGWAGRGKGLPLYLVGGIVARAGAARHAFAAAIRCRSIHGYAMSAEAIARLARTIWRRRTRRR